MQKKCNNYALKLLMEQIKNQMKHLVLLLVFATNFLNAQSFSITGKIALEDNEKMAATSVFLYTENNENLLKAVVTDDTGNFTFQGIKTGNYVLKINYIGFESYTSTVFTINDKNVELSLISLQRATAEL